MFKHGSPEYIDGIKQIVNMVTKHFRGPHFDWKLDTHVIQVFITAYDRRRKYCRDVMHITRTENRILVTPLNQKDMGIVEVAIDLGGELA